MISLERLDAGEQAFIALGDLEVPPPGQAGPPRRFFSTVVKLTPEARQVVPMPQDTLVNHDGHASTFDAYRFAAQG